MDAIKAWFNAYSANIEAILKTIYEFVVKVFNKETEGEFDKLEGIF